MKAHLITVRNNGEVTLMCKSSVKQGTRAFAEAYTTENADDPDLCGNCKSRFKGEGWGVNPGAYHTYSERLNQ